MFRRQDKHFWNKSFPYTSIKTIVGYTFSWHCTFCFIGYLSPLEQVSSLAAIFYLLSLYPSLATDFHLLLIIWKLWISVFSIAFYFEFSIVKLSNFCFMYNSFVFGVWYFVSVIQKLLLVTLLVFWLLLTWQLLA